MHLLHCAKDEVDQPLTVRLEQVGEQPPPYATLSHVWGEGELTFQDCKGLEDITTTYRVTSKKGYAKVAAACERALQDGLAHVWIDTCCIDKSSSAELSEAINSMFRWYEMSQICYALLDDLHDHFNLRCLRKSKWFTRGWTLQELIAPAEVVFLTAEWQEIGTKSSLANQISRATRIRECILVDGLYAHDTSVAEKISWAAGRRTTREEDHAYSLLGLFDVHMPPIYGEGGPNAFRRLQEQIMRVSTDHTIFTWWGQGSSITSGILALSPDQFIRSTLHPVEFDFYRQAFNLSQAKPESTVTNYGLKMQIPILEIGPDYPGYYYAFLAARYLGAASQDEWATIYLYRQQGGGMRQFTRTSFKGMWLEHRKIGLEDFHKETIFIRIKVDTWPLVLDPNIAEPFGTPGLRGVIGGQIERRVYMAFAKKHPTIHIAEYCVNDCPLRCNEVLMLSFKGRWAMRSESGQEIFPDLHKATVARSIQADFVEFDRRTYGSGQHLAFIIMGNGIDRILLVMAIQRGAWLLLLAKIDCNVAVRTVRQDLLSSQEKQDDCNRAPHRRISTTDIPPWLQSKFVGVGVPFNPPGPFEARLGRYFVSIERETRLDRPKELFFRITVGMRPVVSRKAAETFKIKENATKSVISDEIDTEFLRFV
ncbi:HET domain-containing protein [Diaporthe helianthi]|uniref:HET domain-containing protein n=1 Tax=Diaporthe helianthi TaxID=158607 RepID=A0A2P5HEF2_DIAHE|nr:HET domain-containing protein [Diaporthe helianthi]